LEFSSVKHIFFDLDHTLWDFDKNSEKAFEVILKPLFPELKVQDFVDVYNPINQACWKLYQVNKINHEELRYKRLKDTFDNLKISVSDTLINQLSEDYITHLPNNNHLVEGCIDVLEYLHPKYKLHIITNGFAEVQFIKLHNSGIYHFFDTVTNSEMAGVKKPHQAIYKHALEKANAAKEESIMIGDCIQADVEGALNFGINAVFFNPNNQVVDNSVKQISNLVALKTLF
jgi:YjjG family noncanonical pyrimidine nucleotidase